VRNPQDKCIIRAPRVGSLYRVKCQRSTFLNDPGVCDPGPAVLCVCPSGFMASTLRSFKLATNEEVAGE